MISAALLKSCFPLYDVEVISSDTIGIIGVGEGSTEHWRMFETLVGIQRSDVIRETDATFKFGIRFLDWTTAVPDYFHSIAGGQTEHFTAYSLFSSVIAQGKQLTPAFTHPGLPDGYVADNDDLEQLLAQSNQLHFDTHKLNSFLRRVCESIGVSFSDDEIINVNISESGEITSLLGSKRSYETDFVIDCSGFKRKIISALENQKWVSFSDYLPCDSAMVFQSQHENEKDLRGYTIAEAMPAGWRWEIPTQSRIGNGYVYGSEYATQEQVHKQFEQRLDRIIDDPRFIDFSPGTVERPWVANCVAIGLSSNFVEPLEATSISASVLQGFLLTSYLPHYTNDRQWARDSYNKKYDRMVENLLTMICLHYVSDRDDTDLWRDQKLRKKPDFLTYILDIVKNRPLEQVDIPTNGCELFSANHFLFVAQGQGLIKSDSAQRSLQARNLVVRAQEVLASIKAENSNTTLIPHRDALMRGIGNVQTSNI